MPRKPSKAHRQVLGGHNCTVRGRIHCRSQRDAAIGPRGKPRRSGNRQARPSLRPYPFSSLLQPRMVQPSNPEEA